MLPHPNSGTHRWWLLLSPQLPLPVLWGHGLLQGLLCWLLPGLLQGCPCELAPGDRTAWAKRGLGGGLAPPLSLSRAVGESGCRRASARSAARALAGRNSSLQEWGGATWALSLSLSAEEAWLASFWRQGGRQAVSRASASRR